MGKNNKLSKWSFAVAIITAIIVGLLQAVNFTFGISVSMWNTILVILGLVAGITTIVSKVEMKLMLGTILLAIVGGSTFVVLTQIPLIGIIGTLLTGILGALTSVLAPMAVIITLRFVLQKAIKM